MYSLFLCSAIQESVLHIKVYISIFTVWEFDFDLPEESFLV